MAKGKGGFLGHDGINAPDSPTSVSVTGGDGQATVSFTAPSDVGGSAITGYVATSNDGIGAAGSSSPITVTGLTNGTSYTFNVWAINSFGYSAPSSASESVSPIASEGTILFAGGLIPSYTDQIQEVSIASGATGSDFGDLTVGRYSPAACASTTRAVWMGGKPSSGSENVIDYVTFASAGNATDFGDLTTNTTIGAGCNSSTRGLIGGGYTAGGSTQYNVISYITIASTSNATDFGDLTLARRNLSSCSSSTRGVWATGYDGSNDSNVIDYVTISSTGNATDFGDAVRTSDGGNACSNSTRGLMALGYDFGFILDVNYITIASTGNATDFGDLSGVARFSASGAGETKAMFAIYNSTRIDGFTISTTGNGTDFADMLSGMGYMGAASNANGGTQ